MVYGRILYNNIKEYTPKWFPTIPYSQTTKPTFGRKPQLISKWNSQPIVKNGWRLIGKIFQSSWQYQVFLFGLTFLMWAGVFYPTLYIYQTNNAHRTYEAAMTKQKAHQRKLRELQKAAGSQ